MVRKQREITLKHLGMLCRLQAPRRQGVPFREAVSSGPETSRCLIAHHLLQKFTFFFILFPFCLHGVSGDTTVQRLSAEKIGVLRSVLVLCVLFFIFLNWVCCQGLLVLPVKASLDASVRDF